MKYIPKSMTCRDYANQINRKFQRCRQAFIACCEFVQQNLDHNLVLGRHGQSGLSPLLGVIRGSMQRWGGFSFNYARCNYVMLMLVTTGSSSIQLSLKPIQTEFLSGGGYHHLLWSYNHFLRRCKWHWTRSDSVRPLKKKDHFIFNSNPLHMVPWPPSALQWGGFGLSLFSQSCRVPRSVTDPVDSLGWAEPDKVQNESHCLLLFYKALHWLQFQISWARLDKVLQFL